MRRILALVLSLILALGSSAALAQDTPEEAGAVTSIGNVNSLFTVEDSLYAFTWGGLYRLDQSGQSAVFVPSAVDLKDVFRMTAYGDALFAMDYEGNVTSLTLSEDGLEAQQTIGTVPWAQGEDVYNNDAQLVVDDQAVWALMTFSSMHDPYPQSLLYRLDRASGEAVQVEVEALTDLCAYKDGLLLARQTNDQAREAEDRLPKLISIDKTSLSATVLCTLPDGSLTAPAYDEASDLIYLATPTALYRLDSAYQPEKCALLSLSYIMDGTTALLHNDSYLIASGDEPLGFAACGTDPALLPTQTLKIGMGYTNDVTRGFIKAHPEIGVELKESFFAADSMDDEMLSASSEIDVYSILIGYGSIAPLRDKGYYADLSQSAILTDTVGRMYPQYSAHCYSRDGQLFALPHTVQVMGMGYSPAILKELGYTEDELPATYLELLDFLVDYVDMNGDDPAATPMFEMAYDLRQQLYYHMEAAYIGSYLQRNEALTFDTPLFRSLLEGLDKADPMLVALNEDEADNSVTYYSSDSAPSLFTLDYQAHPTQFPLGDYVPLLVTLDEATPPVLQSTQWALLINPYSENLNNAMLYLEYVARHLDPIQAIAMFPDHNEPIQYESYQREYEDYTQQIADLEKRLEAADEASKKSLEEELENAQLWLKDLENWRWAVSAEDIAAYRQLMPFVVLNTEAFSSPSMRRLSSRYLQGQLSADAYITELERLLRMMRLEDQ